MGLLKVQGLFKAFGSIRAVDAVSFEVRPGEIYGLLGDRAALLEEALQREPDYGPARWQQGFFRYQKDWLSVNDIPQSLARSRELIAYQYQ